MEYKTIVVHLDAHPRRMARLDIALRLAAQTGGHLVGLFAIDACPMPRHAVAEWSNALVAAGVREVETARAEARSQFAALAARYPSVTCEWREDAGGALDAVSLSARYADLVVVGQQDPDAATDGRVAAQMLEHLVLLASRPVLVVPYAGNFNSVGERILLAWDSSSQALRAATDALPMLIRASEVQVAVFDAEKRRQQHGELPGADITLFLARHGVKATVSQHRSVEGDVGCAILSRASDMGTDLIVMGAYGHSRTMERMLGGATRTVLQSMTVPVLMSH